MEFTWKVVFHQQMPSSDGITHILGLSEWVVRSPEEIYGLMEQGATVRATGETRMNETSSRSHAVFIIIVEQSETKYVRDESGAEMSSEEVQMLLTRGSGRDPTYETINEHIRQSFKVKLPSHTLKVFTDDTSP